MLLFALAFPPVRERMPTVLLVEDHRDTRQMYAEFLSDGFAVLQSSTAEQALELLKAQVPDVVITDLSLPGMDGFELISRMRSDERLREIPIICMSGYGGVAHEEKARRIGCDRVIEKPCLPDDLARTTRELLREYQDRRRE